MRPIVLRLVLPLALAAAPAAAQEGERPGSGPGLVERGVERMMRGLLEEMAPAIRDIETTMALLEGVIGQVEQYEAPEMLPNGDIIIRRKREGIDPLVDPGDGEVEL